MEEAPYTDDDRPICGYAYRCDYQRFLPPSCALTPHERLLVLEKQIILLREKLDSVGYLAGWRAKE